jgi:hypothetical protein
MISGRQRKFVALRRVKATAQIDQPTAGREVKNPERSGDGKPLRVRNRDRGAIIHQEEIGAQRTCQHQRRSFTVIECPQRRIVIGVDRHRPDVEPGWWALGLRANRRRRVAMT